MQKKCPIKSGIIAGHNQVIFKSRNVFCATTNVNYKLQATKICNALAWGSASVQTVLMTGHLQWLE